MKNSFLAYIFWILILLILNSCREEVELDNGIIIEGLPEQVEVEIDSELNLEFTIDALDGLSEIRLSLNGIEIESNKLSGEKSFSKAFSFNAESGKFKAAEELKLVVFARDKDGDFFEKLCLIKIIESKGSSPIQENPESPSPFDPKIIRVKEDISEDQIWYTGNIYILEKRITVKAPSKLTIQKGVIVKGETNLQETSALVISRGAKIDAQGTSDQPIIFTSSLDLISPGETNPKQNFSFLDMHWWDEVREVDYSKEKGLWGGLIILGKARGSFPGDAIEYSLKGFEGFGESAKYGGMNNEDNSGILKNIFIRFAGNRLDTGKRIPSFTLAGVGSGTIIENIEIYQGAEDGIAIYGGKVNLSTVILSQIAEDGVQIDQGWSGDLDNFIILNTGDNGIEIEGPKGTFNNGNYRLKNGSISCYPCKGYLSFQENSNSIVSTTLFSLAAGLMLGEILFEFGINKTPKYQNSSLENLEVMIFYDPYGKMPSDWKAAFFKDVPEDKIKKVDFDKHSVGPYLNKFISWSWFYHVLVENSAYIPGI
ncbi:hypothetical protein DFQ04_2793 [Algoriphagus boseongensis]|uniref:Uncharacterized protein n=1 Tax=Algoriphagus boseongensis TaxID=1442587 RepID=A0A4R6T7K0_9BACT|nr:hypothetical protein [Algoriphagus boseongensis]TDQ16671.1 hypothetical protein DFQ04_2793 [Algoriphagus boseongensis]